jgi:hypothetical protein
MPDKTEKTGWLVHIWYCSLRTTKLKTWCTVMPQTSEAVYLLSTHCLHFSANGIWKECCNKGQRLQCAFEERFVALTPHSFLLGLKARCINWKIDYIVEKLAQCSKYRAGKENNPFITYQCIMSIPQNQEFTTSTVHPNYSIFTTGQLNHVSGKEAQTWIGLCKIWMKWARNSLWMDAFLQCHHVHWIRESGGLGVNEEGRAGFEAHNQMVPLAAVAETWPECGHQLLDNTYCLSPNPSKLEPRWMNHE